MHETCSCDILSRKLLKWDLKVRKQSAGELLLCVRSVNALEAHIAPYLLSPSKPFFYDQSYRKVNHPSPTAVDSNGGCVVAEEEGDRDTKTERPITPECKQPISEEG